MKKVLLVISVAALFFTACKETKTESSGETEAVETATAEFYCPMKCEGEKTYAEAGKCPECGMDLVEVEE